MFAIITLVLNSQRPQETSVGRPFQVADDVQAQTSLPCYPTTLPPIISFNPPPGCYPNPPKFTIEYLLKMKLCTPCSPAYSEVWEIILKGSAEIYAEIECIDACVKLGCVPSKWTLIKSSSDCFGDIASGYAKGDCSCGAPTATQAQVQQVEQG